MGRHTQDNKQVGMTTSIKGKVVESADGKLRIEVGTGVTNVIWDENVFCQLRNISEFIGREAEIYGTVQKIDENKLISRQRRL